MANPICLSPLKFYDGIGEQNRYRSFAYGHVAPLLTSPNVISPFQLIVSGNATAVYIHDAETNQRVTGNVLSAFTEIGLQNVSVGGFNVLQFPGVYPLETTLRYEGQYWLEIEAGDTYYSEVFCFTNAADNLLKIEYWNPESDFLLKDGIITFANNFHFSLLLNSELGKPEYSFEEEVTKRLGYSFIESQVSKKTYRFNTVVPEYICDAMRIIRLCSNKQITSKGKTYDALSFELAVDWQDQGDLASVTCEFDVDNIITNIGGYKHEPLGGDFNGDFNEDFDT